MRKVGRYLIQERLGRGGMGAVYKARAPITNRIVALKILLPRDDIFVDLVGEDKLREIFIEEARIMGGIDHEHVAKVIDCSGSADVPFIVLEYFPHSLGSLIGDSTRVKTSRVISTGMTFHYIRQILRGLEVLHFAGIIHRDIKPHNLMITNDDRIKIIDFGLCKVRGGEKMVIPGMQIGSPYYTAPEQERNPQAADERSDLFSVGVIAYRLLTGQLVNHREKSIPPPSTINTGLNGDWDEFLLKSTQTKEQHRYKSAYEMRLHLEKIFDSWMRQPGKNNIFAANGKAEYQLGNRTLRTNPESLRPKQVQELCNLDSMMRPKSSAHHRFEPIGKSVIDCHDVRLLWQQQGAGLSLNWNNAHKYINYLNEKKWQGYRRWRLPTVEELSALLYCPHQVKNFCFGSCSSKEIHWIWSCDSCTKKKAWGVDILESYFLELDKDGMAAVCAVVTK